MLDNRRDTRRMAGDGGQPAGLRFEQGHAEPLPDGRPDKQVRNAVEPRERRAPAAAQKTNAGIVPEMCLDPVSGLSAARNKEVPWPNRHDPQRVGESCIRVGLGTLPHHGHGEHPRDIGIETVFGSESFPCRGTIGLGRAIRDGKKRCDRVHAGGPGTQCAQTWFVLRIDRYDRIRLSDRRGRCLVAEFPGAERLLGSMAGLGHDIGDAEAPRDGGAEPVRCFVIEVICEPKVGWRCGVVVEPGVRTALPFVA